MTLHRRVSDDEAAIVVAKLALDKTSGAATALTNGNWKRIVREWA